MKNKSFYLLGLLVPFSLGTLTLLPSEAIAQTQYQGDNPNAGPTGFQTNEQDPMKSLMGGGLNPLELMHRAQTGRSRTGTDFAVDTQQGLSKAASDFKKLQQQQLQQMKTVPTATPAGTATPSGAP